MAEEATSSIHPSSEPKILIIHPKDETTAFLNPLYDALPNATRMNKPHTRAEIEELINSHDRVIMMGHGTPQGLICVGEWRSQLMQPYLVDYTTVPLLKEKKSLFFLWCNADEFVEEHQFKNAWYSGMFVSEVDEADYCGFEATQEQVDESNNGFAQIMAKHITEQDPEILYAKVAAEYSEIATNNPVAQYNLARLYHS